MTLVGGPCGLPVSALWEWLLVIACMAPSAVVIRALQLQNCFRGVPCSPCAHCGCRPLANSPKQCHARESRGSPHGVTWSGPL